MYELDYLPRFRESEADGLVSTKGYFYYFQDIAAGLYHEMGKGNNKLPQKYGVSWVYSKYKLKIYDKTDFDHMIHIATWVSKLDAVRSLQEMRITRGEELLCEGRLESCVVDMQAKKIERLAHIELPDDLAEGNPTAVEPFIRRLKPSENIAYLYTHTIEYTDIDLSRHMNNLHYIDMFMNAFDLDFYDRYFITDFEIHYIQQAYYHEELRIYVEQNGNEYRLFAFNKDDVVAAACVIKVREYEVK